MHPQLSTSCLALLAATVPAHAAVPPINQGPLTLVNETGFNSLSVRLGIPLIGNQTRTSTVSGTVLATLLTDPATDRTSELTLSEGDISATPVSFSISSIFGSVNIVSSTLGGTAFTTAPPGPADPPSGNFDAALHAFLMNEGTLSGTAVGGPINIDLTTAPFSGTGKGTGNVLLNPLPDTATRAHYAVVVILPIDFTNEVPTGTIILGSEIIATVRFTGTMKATGQISVPLSNYLAWTESQGIPGADANADANADGISEGLVWALGLGFADDPHPHLLLPDPAATRGFTLSLPAGGSGGPLFIDSSQSLAPGSWVPVNPADLSLPANPLPAGTTGMITIVPSALPARFLRLRAQP